MAELRILIEEHLCREIKFEVPDGTTLDDEIVEQKCKEIHDLYRKGYIVLTADDYNGTTLVCTQLVNGNDVVEETGWNDI